MSQDAIKKPLADEILFGRLMRGGHVNVVLREGKIAFEIDQASAPPAKAKDEEAEAAE